MIEVADALSRVLQQARPLPAVHQILPAARGLVLAESVTSDVDSPPHDKSLVDGYALHADDVARLPAELDVLEEVTAGRVPTQPLRPGLATRIMTGAPIPQQAAAVVMVEQTEVIGGSGSLGGERVRVLAQHLTEGANIMRQATSLRRGQVVLQPGHRLRGIEVGLLAEVGRSGVQVHPRARVAVLATGDELVEASQRPAAGQIRNSNGPMLAALVASAGAEPIELGIARDQRSALRDHVARGLEHDVLLLSGGVSAGVLDLVPQVLDDLGVVQVFHKVRLKPGKPLWFGVRQDAARSSLVFGLPGNPVSSLVGFELFVRPALAQMAGRAPAISLPQVARLAQPFHHRGDRPTWFPARRCDMDGVARVELLSWQGSADLRTLCDADCLAHFPAGDRQYQVGDEVQLHPLGGW